MRSWIFSFLDSNEPARKEEKLMKGLILSGGKGTRLRPFTYTYPKQLLPVANKPVLFYAIEALVATGIREIGIVVGDTREDIQAAAGDGSCWGAEIQFTYIHQEAPLGLAHAVLTAREFLGRDRFVMMLGDNLIGEPLEPIVRAFANGEYPCQIILAHVENPCEFGVAELELHDLSRSGLEPRVLRLIEKPRIPPSDLALVGIYCFDHAIFEAAENIQPSARGELEITDAIQWLIDSGYGVHPYILQDYWLDTGKMADILAANRLVLARQQSFIAASASVTPDSVLQGSVIVQENAQIVNSVIRGPAIIGERTRIVNSYIGPFSSIYHDVTIEQSEIEYCIVLEHSSICHIPGRIEASLIGRYAEISTSQLKPKAYRLMLGDYSCVGFLT